MRPAALLPLLSFSVLALEIGLTRIFSYLLPYHFSAIAVALAMTGLGVGAWVRLKGAAAPGPRFRLLALAGLAIGTLLVPVAAAFSPSLPVLLLPPLLAFLAAGALVSDCYRTFGPAGAGRAYFLDLAGAACGCLGAVWLMNRVGSPGLCLALSAAMTLAALAAAWEERRPAVRALACATLVAVCALVGPRLEGALSAALPHAPLLRGKLLGERLRKGGAVLDWSYSSFGRADLYRADPERPLMALFNDGMNPTLLVRRDVGRETLHRFFMNLPFELVRPRRALLVGTGAGLEVRLAREAGVEAIEAVEVNPAFIRLARRWRDYAGETYEAPGVRLKVAEGRRTLEGRPGPYDLIAMSLVLSGTQHAASHAPAEAFLFTVEAYRLYLSRLAPHGLLTVLEEVPERTLRQFMTALAALRSRGLALEEALERVAVVAATELESGVPRQMLVVSPEPLSPRVLDALKASAGGYHFAPLWVPGRAAAKPYASVQLLGEERFLELFHLNVRPCEDDRPYFFNMVKGLRSHLRLAAPYLSAAGGAFLAALALSLLSVRAGRLRWRTAGLAAAYGFLFIFCEVALLVRLTLAAGGPVPALTVLLFSLLAWASLGGRLSVRLSSTTPWRIALLGGLAALALAVTLVTLERGYRLYMGLEGPALPLALALTLFPCGFAMGLPFPSLLSRAHGEEVAGLWGINGLASVAGAMLAVLSCMYLGISTSLLAGAFLYAATGIAAALLLR